MLLNRLTDTRSSAVMAVNLMGGSKFKMPQKPTDDAVNRMVERGQRQAAAGGAGGASKDNWNVSLMTAHTMHTRLRTRF